MILLVILVYSVLGYYELLTLYHKKRWKDFWANSVLLLISFAIAASLSLNLEIPSPEAPIRTFITSIFGE